MTKKLLGWLPTAYLGCVLIYYFRDFLWGSLGTIRAGDVENGKIEADYAITMIANFSSQARNLYLLLFVGFILTILVKIKFIKGSSSA